MQYFGFLLDMGYQVRRVDFHPEIFGNWEMVFETKNNIVEIGSDKNEIMVHFLPLSTNGIYRFSIKEMIYFLSHGREFVDAFRGNLFWGRKKQYEELAKLLKTYINQIEPYFGDNFHEYRTELLSSQRAYFEQLVNRRIQENKF